MALIPPFFLDTVVALGVMSGDGEFVSTGTGFLYGHPTDSVDPEGNKQYQLLLVTNRHVIDGILDQGATMYARLNSKSGTEPGVIALPLVRSGAPSPFMYLPPTGEDIGIISISAPVLDEQELIYHFFAGGDHTFSSQRAIEAGVSEGDGIFVLGFPLGDVGTAKNYAIVKQGVVARIQNWLAGGEGTFLIDASIFPGNSGGPVILRPEINAIAGTKFNNAAGLVGMVAAYIPYQEVAISQQTKRPRMIFEENSGLGEVITCDVIERVCEAAVVQFQSHLDAIGAEDENH